MNSRPFSLQWRWFGMLLFLLPYIGIRFPWFSSPRSLTMSILLHNSHIFIINQPQSARAVNCVYLPVRPHSSVVRKSTLGTLICWRSCSLSSYYFQLVLSTDALNPTSLCFVHYFRNVPSFIVCLRHLRYFYRGHVLSFVFNSLQRIFRRVRTTRQP